MNHWIERRLLKLATKPPYSKRAMLELIYHYNPKCRREACESLAEKESGTKPDHSSGQ